MSQKPEIEASSFCVSANPKSDLWRKPPSTNSTNPALKPLCTLDLASFKSAGVTFTADWVRQYDQGGIALFLTLPETPQNKWIKSGIEFYQGQPFMGTVCTDNWSDWSLAPVTEKPSGVAGGAGDYVTVEARAEGDELGRSLWIYQLLYDADGKEVQRVPLRECTWALAQVEGVKLEVAAYAARPAEPTGSDDVLEVKFKKAWVEKL